MENRTAGRFADRDDALRSALVAAHTFCVRGPNVMAGYWDRADATRDTIDEDGWLRTGDAARIDDEGFVWIVDRVEDAYKVSGHAVYPGDVERVLAHHPAADVGGVAATDGEGSASSYSRQARA